MGACMNRTSPCIVTQATQGARQMSVNHWMTSTTQRKSRIKCMNDGHLLLGTSRGHEIRRIYGSFSWFHVCPRTGHSDIDQNQLADILQDIKVRYIYTIIAARVESYASLALLPNWASGIPLGD